MKLLGFPKPMDVSLFSLMGLAHTPNSFWPVLNHGEPAVLYCFIFLYLAAAGVWAVDRLIGQRQ
jgi:putative oxidoreductase